MSWVFCRVWEALLSIRILCGLHGGEEHSEFRHDLVFNVVTRVILKTPLS